MLGLGVMIKTLGGNEETVTAIKKSLGKTIQKVWLDKDRESLMFEFSDDTKLEIYDDGQSCCEIRHMETDDDLSEFVGAKILDFELKDAPDQEDEYGVHEV